MAEPKPVKLSDKQAKKMEQEYQRLLPDAIKQAAETAAFVRKHVAKDKHLDDAQRAHLDQLLTPNEENICPGLRVKLVRVTDANAIQKNHIQVTHEFHDDLFEYLRRPESVLPRELRGYLDGGSLIDPKTNKPLMEDLAPQTGKTRTGVPKYDAILEAQERAKRH